MSDTLNIYRRDEHELIQELEEKKYKKHESTYDYLLTMNMRSFTDQKLQQLDNKLNNMKHTIKTLEKTTEKMLWINDLETLKSKLI